MNYTLKALFLALVMFLMLDIVKTAGSKIPKESSYKAFAESHCRDLCR